jgi:hypothetical protein
VEIGVQISVTGGGGDGSTAITREITNTIYDGFENGDPATWQSTGYFFANVAPVGQVGAVNQSFGSYHYQNINIPKDTVIKSATWIPHITYVSPLPDQNQSGIVRAEYAGAPGVPSNTNRPSGMTLTTASGLLSNADLLIADAGINVDVTSVMQEVINHASWVSGNDMNLITTNTSSPATGYSSIALVNRAGYTGNPLLITY